MATLVHITADLPDAFAQAKTPAVRRLLALAPRHRHIVYSINRSSGLGGVHVIARGGDGVVTLVYRALPYGLLLRPGLVPLARCIAEDLRTAGIRPDLVHAHKLSIEGIVADRVAAVFGVPFIASVWGNTDQKVIAGKPLMRGAFRALAHRARLLLPATPWASDWTARTLGVSSEKLRLLPVVCDLKPFAPSSPAGPRFCTLFHLDHWRLKNLPALIAAIAEVRRGGLDASLDILGGGSDAARTRILHAIEHAGLRGHVTLAGAVPHADVQATLTRYAALVLPSRRETFGMVLVEALFAGVPVLYPAGQAIDGFLDGVEAGIRVDAASVSAIAAGLRRLAAEESALKGSIAALHARGFFRRFEPDTIGSVYEGALRDALAG